MAWPAIWNEKATNPAAEPLSRPLSIYYLVRGKVMLISQSKILECYNKHRGRDAQIFIKIYFIVIHKF